ncbi:MAG: hypothetical protein WCC12_23840 [Anaerolineales bacterium]
MNRSYLRHILMISVVLVAVVACVLPGQTIQPTPGISADTVATAVVGTAQAASTQTAAAQSLATEVSVMPATNIEQAQDGTTRYTDYDGGFEIIFPVGWLAVRPNSEEFNVSLAKAGAANPMLHEQMTADLAGYDANFDRLYAYVLRPDIKKNVMLGFSKLTWDSDDTAVTIDNFTMGELTRGLEASGGLPGFRADTVQLHEDGSVRMIEIGGRWSMSDGEGGTIPFYSTIIFFKPTSSSTVRITFTFMQDYQAQIAADVKSITGSIRVIEP